MERPGHERPQCVAHRRPGGTRRPSSQSASGGQQQRVAIARSLINNPQIILADEPTGALDSRTSIEIMIFQRLNREQGISIILVTHEPDIAQYGERIISFKDGHIISDHTVRDRRNAQLELEEQEVPV
jgi:putative ABC transport system ATP-binding protein